MSRMHCVEGELKNLPLPATFADTVYFGSVDMFVLIVSRGYCLGVSFCRCLGQAMPVPRTVVMMLALLAAPVAMSRRYTVQYQIICSLNSFGHGGKSSFFGRLCCSGVKGILAVASREGSGRPQCNCERPVAVLGRQCVWLSVGVVAVDMC